MFYIKINVIPGQKGPVHKKLLMRFVHIKRSKANPLLGRFFSGKSLILNFFQTGWSQKAKVKQQKEELQKVNLDIVAHARCESEFENDDEEDENDEDSDDDDDDEFSLTKKQICGRRTGKV